MRLQSWRDAHFAQPGLGKHLQRRLYLWAIYVAFDERVYGFVNWLQEETPFLDRLTKAYHLDEKIHLPPDHLDRMIAVEAQVGLVQLEKYHEIVRRRQEHALFYDQSLRGRVPWELPPLVEGATYSHYVIRVPDRKAVMAELLRAGIQLGELIEYSIPHMASYAGYAGDGAYPNSLLCSRQTINLPVYANLSAAARERIVACLTRKSL
jgi:dTDP-4-amino-4,6-dideoxygalactose transaminase